MVAKSRLTFFFFVMPDSFATLWTVAHQALLSMVFLRQEYWSGLPFPSPEDLPDPGIEPASPASQVDSFTTETPGKPFEVRLSTDQKWLGQRSRRHLSRSKQAKGISILLPSKPCSFFLLFFLRVSRCLHKSKKIRLFFSFSPTLDILYLLYTSSVKVSL